MEGAGGRVESGRSALAGATVMLVVPSLDDDFIGCSAFNGALAALRTGARAIVASSGGSLVGELQASGGEWMQLEPLRHRLARSKIARQVRELIGAERIDLIHAFGLDLALEAVAGLQGSGTRLLTTYLHTPIRRPFVAAFRSGPRFYGHAVVVPSTFAADFVARSHAIERARIIVIPRPVDMDHFDPQAMTGDRIVAVREAWGTGRRRIVLVPGRIAEGKGQLALIEAVRVLVNGGLRDVIFVIAGSRHSEAAHIRRVDEAIAANGLRDIVRRVGPCRDMPAAYAAAAFVCLPSQRETLFSEIAAEAQAMARPLVASDAGALRETVMTASRVDAAYRTGWLFRHDEPIDLARALAEALSLTPDTWRATCARAREFAEWKHAPTRVVELLIDTYAALLGPD